MRLEELKNRIKIIKSAGFGHKEIEIFYKGNFYLFITTNTSATDRLLNYDISDRKYSGRYTLKQAYKALWNEGIAALGLR